MANSRTPCGCVDLNKTSIDNIIDSYESHPLWVRGLKSVPP